MTAAETYRLASLARSKLYQQADQADRDLRLLVGHANLLDVLIEGFEDVTLIKPQSPKQAARLTDRFAEELSELDNDSDSDSDGSDLGEGMIEELEDDTSSDFGFALARWTSQRSLPLSTQSFEALAQSPVSTGATERAGRGGYNQALHLESVNSDKVDPDSVFEGLAHPLQTPVNSDYEYFERMLEDIRAGHQSTTSSTQVDIYGDYELDMLAQIPMYQLHAMASHPESLSIVAH